MPDEKPKVLLVEDNAGDARLIREALKDAGERFELIWTTRLEKSIPVAPKAELILLDLSLPDSAGLATLQRIRGVAPHAPIVVLTASKDEEAAFKALRQGAQDYVSKEGMDGAALDRALRYAMERQRARDEVELLQRQLAAYDKLAAIGTMVASVAHEVNNPLFYVRTTVENSRFALQRALKADGLPDGARAAIEEALANEQLVLEGVDRVSAIVRSLKTWSRTGSGERVPTDLNDLVRQALTVASSRLHAVKLRTALRATRPVPIDPGAISQVLLNLILNATDAMQGRPDPELAIHVFHEEGWSVVEVKDNGPGIPPEVAARLFTPFFTTKEGGTGLGLSVSHGLVLEHGGTLTFRSAPGEGTTFILRLPAEARRVEVPGRAMAKAPVEPQS